MERTQYDAISILPVSMRRFSGIVSLFALIATPMSALALATSPATLLSQMNFRGNPHTMEAQLHMQYGDTHLSAWMKGAAEGATPQTTKAWQNFTIDIAQSGEMVRAKGAVRMAHGSAYIKLLSIEGNSSADLSQLHAWVQKPWVNITMPEDAMDQPSFIAALTASMQAVDSAITEADVRALLDAVTDSLFSMESERFQSGVAYSLRLAPHGLDRAMQAVQSSMIGDALGLHTNAMDLLGDLPINLHIRVNTNNNGDLVFAKWYAATEMEGISLVLQGKTQWQGHPVYVEIPKKTIAWEEVAATWNMLDIGSMEGSIPDSQWEELLKGEEEAQTEDEDDHAMDRPARTVRPPRPTEIRWNTGCSATPGTPAFIQQSRKGQCMLPPRDTYRINELSSSKKLNPRTTRQKNPAVR